MLVTGSCPVVTVQLNYMDRMSRRFVLINTAKHTIEADLISGIITVDRERESFTVKRDSVFRSMHQAILSGRAGELCSLDEAMEVLRLIEAAERANRDRAWVSR